MNHRLRLGLPALAVGLLSACSPPGAPTTYAGPTAQATSPSPSGPLLRALFVLSPVGLSLRDGPSSSGQAIGHVAQGTQLTATEFRPGSPGWYHVTYNGTPGWVADRDVRSSPPQALVTPHPQLAYSNPGAGYYFLYPAAWGVNENGADVEVTSPPPAGQSPQPQPSGAAPILGVTPTRLIVHVAPDLNSLGATPTTSGAILDTLDFE
ncbi:MAG: SH3 domain-containing protein, partial [Actinomycetota bacterium]|nr:SH3 domain-containing protein [Actinomycetota bacterium]